MEVDGTGTGDLSTGYSQYASLGSYTLQGTLRTSVCSEERCVIKRKKVTAERRRSSRLKAVGLRPIEVGGEKGKIESMGQKESGLRI